MWYYYKNHVFRTDKKGMKIIGQKCNILDSFSQYPADSKIVSLFEIQYNDDNSSGENCEPFSEFSTKDILYKGVLLPYQQNFVFPPFYTICKCDINILIPIAVKCKLANWNN